MQTLNNAHIECIINGHRVTGLADEDRPFEFQTGEDMADISYGPDGGMYGTNNAMFGGTFTVRVQPASPTAQWGMKEKESWKQALLNGEATTVFNGSYADPVQGRNARMEGGILLQCPDMSEPGQTFEIVFQFERIITNVDAATFLAPVSGAA